jgi:hypothetical protein
MHPCKAALPGSLARQPCRKVCNLFLGRMHAVLHTFTQVQAFPAIKDIAILSLVYELISTYERG